MEIPSSSSDSAGESKTGDILVLVGAILGIIIGLLQILSIFGFLWGISSIVISLIILATTEIVPIDMLALENNWVIILVLGIVLLIINSWLSGLLVIIGTLLKSTLFR